MSQPDRLQDTAVPAWTSLWFFAVVKWKAIQLSLERRKFESRLETIVRAALAHRSNGLPAGDRQYKLLRDQANAICTDFAGRWNVDPDLLDAQIPALRKLRSLADPPPKPSPAVLASLGVVAATMLFFLIGVLAGLTSVGYHLVGGR